MEAISEALMTQFTSIGTSLTGVVTGVLPIALPIIGGVFVITKGIGIFKKIANK